MISIDSWIKGQRDWLCQLYGRDGQDGKRELPQACVQSHLLRIFDNMLCDRLLPKDAATQTASVIMAEADVGCAQNLIGLFHNAVDTFEDETVSQKLVDYIVALASLPDAHNDSNEAKMMDCGGGQMVYVQPGDVMAFEDGTFWKDLPGFSMNFTESFQG